MISWSQYCPIFGISFGPIRLLGGPLKTFFCVCFIKRVEVPEFTLLIGSPTRIFLWKLPLCSSPKGNASKIEISEKALYFFLYNRKTKMELKRELKLPLYQFLNSFFKASIVSENTIYLNNIYMKLRNAYYAVAQWAKTRKKVHFGLKGKNQRF